MDSLMLTNQEINLLNLLFNLYPHWKAPIINQIEASTVQREYNGTNFSILFLTEQKITPLTHVPKMPVEIILGHVILPNQPNIKMINGSFVTSPCTLTVPDDDAVSVRFYFNDGCIAEIEVYSLNGKRIEKELNLDVQRTYISYT